MHGNETLSGEIVYKITYIFANSNAYKHSFFPRVIPLWNSLHVDAVSAELFGSFRGGLVC